MTVVEKVMRAQGLRSLVMGAAEQIRHGSASISIIQDMSANMIELDALCREGVLPEPWSDGANFSVAEHAAHVATLNDQINALVEFRTKVNRASAATQGAERELRETLAQIVVKT